MRPAAADTALSGPSMYGDIVNHSMTMHTLAQQLGLKLEPHKGPVEVPVVDSAERIPAAN